MGLEGINIEEKMSGAYSTSNILVFMERKKYKSIEGVGDVIDKIQERRFQTLSFLVMGQLLYQMEDLGEVVNIFTDL